MTLRREWPEAQPGSDAEAWLHETRDDLVLERPGDRPGTFRQAAGPFADYERTVESGPDGARETLHFRLVLPWFGWLFRWAAKRDFAARRPGRDPHGRQPWWAPPDRLDPRQVVVLGMLAAASMSSAFVNTLFTQTVKFSADDFGVSEWAKSVGGTAVRLGVVLTVPIAMLADRVGRRRIIVATAWAAPIVSGLGGLAPNFPILVVTQSIGRPLGLVLSVLIGVAAAEEMPRSSRAYAVSIIAMAAGLGAGVAVLALPLADISEGSWRLVYFVALLWLPIAISLGRRLPETERFQRELARREAATTPTTEVRRSRLIVQCSVGFLANVLAAPASFFLGTFLEDERGFNASGIALFTLLTGTPTGLGLIVGGRLADRYGRRAIGAACVPLGAVLIVVSFAVGGPIMWIAALAGGLVTACAYPAMQVYTTEMFATGRRGLANGIITASALVGGSVGLLIAGAWLDTGTTMAVVMSAFLVGPAAVSAIVILAFPETAHRELEELNPEDAPGESTVS